MKDVSASMDSALQAVGRTVVNFQRLEHNLKRAARLGPLEGTLAKIQRDAEKRAERAGTLTLGQAIQAWLSAAYSEPVEVGHTADLFDATMQMTVSLVPDPEVRSAHSAALKSLLETRNRLVHGGLVEVQWNSPDECTRLIAELDGVNKEIRVQMEFVTSILSALSSLSTLHQEDIERAFDNLLKQDESDSGGNIQQLVGPQP